MKLYKLKRLKGAYIHWVPIHEKLYYIVDMGAYNHGMPIFYGRLYCICREWLMQVARDNYSATPAAELAALGGRKFHSLAIHRIDCALSYVTPEIMHS